MTEFKTGTFYRCHLGALVICTDPQDDGQCFSGVLVEDTARPLPQKAGSCSDGWMKFAFIATEISITEI